jgi:hypothetical protein
MVELEWVVSGMLFLAAPGNADLLVPAQKLLKLASTSSDPRDPQNG